jgi:hypothetical protein
MVILNLACGPVKSWEVSTIHLLKAWFSPNGLMNSGNCQKKKSGFAMNVSTGTPVPTVESGLKNNPALLTVKRLFVPIPRQPVSGDAPLSTSILSRFYFFPT